MAGHSHWAQIKHKKAQTDIKKSKILNKLINNIVIAAKDGADPELNPKLRSAVEKAKEFGVSKENIEKAIKRGSGSESGTILEQIIYEGYGPGGVALVIKSITDNRNRSAAQIRSVFNRHDAKLAIPGSVIWNFEEKGVIVVEKSDKISEESLFSLPIKDIKENTDSYVLMADVERINDIRKDLENMGINIKEIKIEFLPKNYIEIDEKNKAKLQDLIDELLELDDVQEVYTNLNE